MCDSRCWPHLYIIGLTGGIATGKSTVSSILRQLGAQVIDADEIARALTMPGAQGLKDLVKALGPDILSYGGVLDRKKLGDILFGDEKARAIVNSILHPLIIEKIRNTLDDFNRLAAPGGEGLRVVLDVPLLFETGIDTLCDEVWVVAVGPELQIERLKERNGYSREEALLRIGSQMGLDEKIQRAHRVIDNSGSRESTRTAVKGLWFELDREM